MGRSISQEEVAELVGEDLGSSDWFQIDQTRIDGFAESTDDFQFIHVDADAAAKTPFGGTVAHGFLTLSLLTKLCSDLLLNIDGTIMVLNYGFDKVRFLAPVKEGAKVRARAHLLDAAEKGPGQFLVKMDVTVEIGGETKPALVAEWLTMTILE